MGETWVFNVFNVTYSTDWMAGWLAGRLYARVTVCVCVRNNNCEHRACGKCLCWFGFFLFLLKLYWRFECETDWIISTLTQSMGGAYDYTIQPEANIQKQSGGLVFYHISRYTKRFDEKEKILNFSFFIVIIFMIFFYLFIYLLL